MGTEYLLGLLVALLAWIGQRIHVKLDTLTEKFEEKMDQVNQTLSGIERDLKNDIFEHDKRISALEFLVPSLKVIKGSKHGSLE